jgi:hypothetical protein
MVHTVVDLTYRPTNLTQRVFGEAEPVGTPALHVVTSLLNHFVPNGRDFLAQHGTGAHRPRCTAESDRGGRGISRFGEKQASWWDQSSWRTADSVCR